MDGYRIIFEENGGKKKVFNIGNLEVMVYMFLQTDDINRLSQDGYRKYWFDSIDNVLANILEAKNFDRENKS